MLSGFLNLPIQKLLMNLKSDLLLLCPQTLKMSDFMLWSTWNTYLVLTVFWVTLGKGLMQNPMSQERGKRTFDMTRNTEGLN